MRPRDEAIRFHHIQFNSAARKNWLLFDLDYKNALDVIEDTNVALPTLLIENPASGHAKAAYLLDAGVTCYDKSGALPISFLSDVERGYVRRLGADRSYCGFLGNNPLSPAWRVHHLREGGYSLGEMNNRLEPKDKRLWLPGEREAGLGRNVSLFDSLRTIAYREVREFKFRREDYAAYCKRLLDVALHLNRTLNFVAALAISEVRQIVKSVAKWTWKHFSVEGFKAVQSKRGKRGMASRWAGHVSLAKLKPWEALGISERTYYRRKPKGSPDT